MLCCRLHQLTVCRLKWSIHQESNPVLEVRSFTCNPLHHGYKVASRRIRTYIVGIALPSVIHYTKEAVKWSAHQDSNLDQRFRRPTCYPLHHGRIYLLIYCCIVIVLKWSNYQESNLEPKHRLLRCYPLHHSCIDKVECLSGIEPELEASKTSVLSFTLQTRKVEYPPGIEPGP